MEDRFSCRTETRAATEHLPLVEVFAALAFLPQAQANYALSPPRCLSPGEHRRCKIGDTGARSSRRILHLLVL